MKESTKKIGKKAGGIWAPDYDDFLFATVDLDRFAELVRQDEREACAKVCDEWSKTNWTFYDFAKEIRARGDKHD